MMRVKVFGPIFRILFMVSVRVRVRVISGYNVIINMCTAVHIQIRTPKGQISSTAEHARENFEAIFYFMEDD